ncbi:Uncharacterised protein [Vibrio cholerae]|uniref:Uncharacterized protein n=1 Tax=Vibrio cholerae TaxID=666 RepID=A0A655ZC85_VIBCL|nr:Uncharacterised protein [Vibrio cholerae]CSB46812.1 Uncharacterised protein [Vibrio cholerae]CSB78023.1 Uncharacterised protein [Vibrio cholerae]CSC18320.1 Uncharacterised protein [Vibrio cholerae]CSC67071.1 Uncharacterised protein [Vibrio cholerae]
MRLWAASRPVSILPDSRTVSPVFHVWISSRVMLSRLTRRVFAPASQVICGQSSNLGGVNCAGPLPSSVKCTWRVAAQLGIMQTGLEAACVGADLIFTSTTVVKPPRPCAPIPSLFTRLKMSKRSSSSAFCGPRSISS